MTKHILMMAALAGFVSTSVYADEKPAIIVKKASETKFVKVTNTANIKIDTSSDSPVFVVNDGEAEGESISFGMYSFADDVSTIIESLSATKEVSAVEYYSASGTKLTEPQRGIMIVKVLFTDGTSKQFKTIKK